MKATVEQRLLVFVCATMVLHTVVLLVGFRTDQLPAALVILPMAIAVIVAARRRRLGEIETLLRPSVAVTIAVIQCVAWLALILVDYFSIEFNLMDTGSFAHVVSNVASGRGYFNDLFGKSAWADHFAPNLYLIAPLYRLWPTFLWLPLLKVLAFAACLPILWRLTGHYINRTGLRVLVLLMWLTNYPLARVMAFEFQPSTLAMPLILLVFTAWLDNRRWLSLLCLVVVLGFKEHMALVLVCFGLWLAVDRRRLGAGLAVAGVGVVLGLLIVLVLTPWLAHGYPNQHLERLAPFALLGPKLWFVVSLLAYVGFIPVAAPRTLLWALPGCALTLASGYPNMVTLYYHYQDLPATVTFVAVVVGIARLERMRGWVFTLPAPSRAWLQAATLLLIVVANAYFPGRLIRQHWPTAGDLAIVHELRMLRPQLDRDRTLFVLDSLGPYFVDLPRLRMIDNVDSPFQEPGARYVLAAECVNPWPIGERLADLQHRLNTMASRGAAERWPGTGAILLFEIPP